MPNLEFPGTSCAIAVNAAAMEVMRKVSGLALALTKAVTPNGTISAEALHDLSDEVTNSFANKLYEELLDQGVEIR